MKKGKIYYALRSIYWFIIDKIIFDIFLFHYGRYKHKKNISTCIRSQSHTYTSFYRSPSQLSALLDPVLDFLNTSNTDNLSIAVFAGSNGAEAYTIASILTRYKPHLNFTITSSDLHSETTAKANSATYKRHEITQGQDVPEDFIDFTFNRTDNNYIVKDAIKGHIKFIKADLLDPNLADNFKQYDIIFLQNVLFHLSTEQAKQAFSHVIPLLKSCSALFIDGMELDLREELTQLYNLKPVDYKTGEIYQYSRRHIPRNWWNYYYGNEPYCLFNKWNKRRFCTIFTKDKKS